MMHRPRIISLRSRASGGLGGKNNQASCPWQLGYKSQSPLHIRCKILFTAPSEQKTRPMDHKIRCRPGWQFPEISLDSTDPETSVENPFALKLQSQLFRITNGQDNPNPALVMMKPQKQIATDKPAGTREKQLHGLR